jgi:membrane protein CcdC involved in cytochrome C biogenesis
MLSLKEMSVLSSIVGAAVVFAWRVREGRSAVTVKKIVMPPVGMATGFCMFLVPAFRIPPLWALAAFLIGATILAYPLLRTSRLIRDGENVMMQRSNIFFVVIVALALIRIVARNYFDALLTLNQTGALFFVLAFGMILRWRMNMYFQYRRLTADPSVTAPSLSS